MDKLTTIKRSQLMAAVRARNTMPEIVVRSMAHKLGYRFRIHRKDLPGRPDLVFPSRRSIIFVHGCFWHRHEGCRKATMPKSNEAFWTSKFYRNTLRDAAVESQLLASGWKLLTIWECQVKDREELAKRLTSFLGPRENP